MLTIRDEQRDILQRSVRRAFGRDLVRDLREAGLYSDTAAALIFVEALMQQAEQQCHLHTRGDLRLLVILCAVMGWTAEDFPHVRERFLGAGPGTASTALRALADDYLHVRRVLASNRARQRAFWDATGGDEG